MKTEITYSTKCTLTIYFVESCDLASADFREQFKNLQDALNMAEFIFETLYPKTAAKIMIWDSNTGEILAECSPDAEAGPTEVEEDYFDDWDYNEDMGYDPYMGCYTDDC